MNVIDFNNKNKNKPEPKEISSIANMGGAAIHVYHCLFMDKVEYRLRRTKDNALVCEFDKDLNMIGGLKVPVDVKQYENALRVLRIQKQALDEVDEYMRTFKANREANKSKIDELIKQKYPLK